MNKKGLGKTFRTILIIVLVILVLLIILRFLFRWFWGPGFREYNPDIPEFPGEEYSLPDAIPDYPDNIQQTSTRDFESSDKLTTISFTRIGSIYDGDSEEYDSTDIEINLVLTGYLREVPTSLSNEPLDYLRDYVFDEDSVQWNIYTEEIHFGSRCIFTYTISEEGSDSSVNLGDTSVSETYRKVKISYAGEEGYPEDSQLSVEGLLMFNLDETNDIKVLQVSENVWGVCNGHTESTVFTEERIVKFSFPLVLKNVDISQKKFSGSFTFDEDESPAIDAFLDNDVMELPYTITEIEPVLWDVEWEINLP
jgi:hypothetical protein